MQQITSIFENAIRSENSFTELLCNYMRFDSFRIAFLELINEKIKIDFSKIGPDNFKTQARVNSKIIPDLQILSDDLEILIEIKVDDIGLTKNQPAGYYKYLDKECKKGNKGLILLCPKHYKGKFHFKNQALECDNQNTKIKVEIIDWEQIMDIIEKINITETSPYYSELNMLLNSQFYLFKPIKHELMNELYSSKVPEALEKMIANIDVYRRAVLSQGYNAKISSPNDWSEHGFYYDFKSGGTVFFGIWKDSWNKYEQPVCISADDISEEAESSLNSILKEFGFSELVDIKSEKLNYPTTPIDGKYLSEVDYFENLKEMLFRIGQLSKLKKF